MEPKISSSQIPASVKPFFQEYNFAKLNISLHKTLLIERILAFGSRNEIQWLIDIYGKPSINEWLAQSGLRHLPWRRYHMWCLVFGLPEPVKEQRIWAY